MSLTNFLTNFLNSRAVAGCASSSHDGLGPGAMGRRVFHAVVSTADAPVRAVCGLVVACWHQGRG